MTDDKPLDGSIDKPIEKLVNAIMLSAIQKGASHIRVTPAPLAGIAGPGVYFWIEGAWVEEMSPPPELYLPLVRRLGVMIGVLPPRKGEPWFGRLCMQVGDDRLHYFLIAIDRGDTLHALVELVDEVAYKAKRQPRPPSPHPYRSS